MVEKGLIWLGAGKDIALQELVQVLKSLLGLGIPVPGKLQGCRKKIGPFRIDHTATTAPNWPILGPNTQNAAIAASAVS
jgi:hypothetical protein